MLDVLLLKPSGCQLSGLHRLSVIFGPLDYLHVCYQVCLVKQGSLGDPISSLILHRVRELVRGQVVPLQAV
jgi:hypothetical protein